MANRPRFSQRELNDDAPYLPVTPSREAAAVRNLLHTDTQETDYFVLGPYQALAASVHLHELLDISMEPALQPRLRSYYVHGGYLLDTDGVNYPSVCRKPEALPAHTRMQLSRLDQFTARLSADTLYSDIAIQQVRYDTLSVQWPEWSGVTGYLRRASGPLLEDPVVIDADPVTYPAASVIATLLRDGSVIQLLDRHNLLGYFAGAFIPSERLALVAAALIKDSYGSYSS